MNAPSLSEIRSAAERELADEKMEQIRELLVGDSVRRLEHHVAQLEARLSDIEIGVTRQLDALESRIDGIAGAASGERRENFESLARSVAELSDHIRKIARS